MTKNQLHLSGLHCVNCSMLIEEELADIGVKAVCNYAKQTVDVSFDEQKVPMVSVIATIEKLGYRVVR